MQEKKISDLEMELSRFKKTGNGSKNNQNQINNTNSDQLKLNDGGVSVYNISRNNDSFNIFHVPQSFFSFLFSNGPAVLHAPVLNV